MITRSSFITTLFILFTIFFTACAASAAPAATPSPSVEEQEADLANPASIYCEEQGYRMEIRTADDQSQSGVCIFTDGSECDEWAFYRKECSPGTLPAVEDTKGLPTADPQLQEKVVEAVRSQLADQLKVDAASITVESVESRLWKDSCLGLGTDTEMCAMAITPGFLVVLTVGGQQYTFHTNDTASAVRQEK